MDVDDVVEGILAAGERGQSVAGISSAANLTFAQIFDRVAVPWESSHEGSCFQLDARSDGQSRMDCHAGAWQSFLTPQIVGDLFAFKYYSSGERSKNSAGHRDIPFRRRGTRINFAAGRTRLTSKP